MKKLLLIISIFCFGYSSAQTPVLWGLTSLGGSNNVGTLFSINGDGSNFDSHYSFAVATGDQPLGGVIKASNGKLYSTDYWDGAHSYGAIFSVDSTGSNYADLYDFDNTHGAYPGANLTQLTSNNVLYGVTEGGGADTYGVIFRFDPSSLTYSDLYDFDMTNGGLPEHCTLVYNSNGKLYGLASSGGTSSDGVIFSYNPTSLVYKDEYNFNGTDGSFPLGGLVLASNGKFYGLTGNGGTNSLGVLFSFDPSDSTYTALYSFAAATGSRPWGSLIQASNGLLYGMTHVGGASSDGVIFSYDPVGNTYTKLYDFDGTHGAGPEGTLIQATDGNLYGMTYAGGASSKGVVFSYNIITNIYKDILDFKVTNGSSPYGQLLQLSTINGTPPVASFQASEINLCTTNCINFTDESSNSPTSWSWTFQGAADSTSTEQNPQNICYLNAGTFAVKLVVSNGSGQDSTTVSSYINVDPAPPVPVITQSHDTLYCIDSATVTYQWYNDSVLINGATEQFYVVTQGGDYSVKVTNAGGCSVAAGINGILGLQSLLSVSNIHFNIFPNPATDEVVIGGNLLSGASGWKINIYNILGEVIYTKESKNNSQTLNPPKDGSAVVDCRSFSPGMYFVEVLNENSSPTGRIGSSADRLVSKFIKE